MATEQERIDSAARDMGLFSMTEADIRARVVQLEETLAREREQSAQRKAAFASANDVRERQYAGNVAALVRESAELRDRVAKAAEVSTAETLVGSVMRRIVKTEMGLFCLERGPVPSGCICTVRVDTASPAGETSLGIALRNVGFVASEEQGFDLNRWRWEAVAQPLTLTDSEREVIEEVRAQNEGGLEITAADIRELATDDSSAQRAERTPRIPPRQKAG